MTRQDIDILSRNFQQVAGPTDKIDRSRFRDMLADVFGVDDSLIMDRGFAVDTVFRCFDLDADNYIGYDEYMKGMAIYLKGKYEEKLKCR